MCALAPQGNSDNCLPKKNSSLSQHFKQSFVILLRKWGQFLPKQGGIDKEHEHASLEDEGRSRSLLRIIIDISKK